MHEVGDRVRIKATGSRGVVLRVEGSQVVIEVEGTCSAVSSDAITNYSLAARKAWKTRPKRAGRPRLQEPRKRLISIRLDVDLLDRLAVLAERGDIKSREAAVNEMLREELRRRAAEVSDGQTRRDG